MRRSMLVLTLVAALLVAGGVTVLAQSTESSNGQPDQSIELDPQFAVLESGQEDSGQNSSLSEAQNNLLSQGYLLPEPDTLGEFKDAAAAQGEAPQSSGESTSGESTSGESTSGGSTSLKDALGKSALSDIESALDTTNPTRSTSSSSGAKTPTTVARSRGLNDPKVGPSDSTSAVGLDRYIETVNNKYGIYKVTGISPTIGQGVLTELFGVDPKTRVSDPQMIWDPDTSRFYYAGLALFSPTDNRLEYGFSKTDKPTSAADFCHYSTSFGDNIPDYPKLGDTQNLLLIGFNSFNARGNYRGSQLSGVQKPPSGSSCPQNLPGGTTGLLNGGGVAPAPFTPVPANQTDGSTTGHVVSTSQSLITAGGADVLPLLEVVEAGAGFTFSYKALSVPTYRVPADAEQWGTPNRLDTLDGRNTQAVSAIDPSQGNKVALWTQHTIFGGGGAGVRWYEIDPDTPSVLRSEDLAQYGRYIFNAAISPDRAVNGSTARFGDSMLLGANFSSRVTYPGLLLEEQTGSKAGSFAAYQLSRTYLADFTCSGKAQVCRWGDYAGMSPYPATPSSAAH